MENITHRGHCGNNQLYQLIRYYARKWPVMIVAILVGIGLGAAYALSIQQPQYKKLRNVAANRGRNKAKTPLRLPTTPRSLPRGGCSIR